MFKEGKLCSAKCNGMFNSPCNIIDHTPLSMPGFLVTLRLTVGICVNKRKLT